MSAAEVSCTGSSDSRFPQTATLLRARPVRLHSGVMNRSNEPYDRQYDVVVIGGGAAGLSAALVLSRARRRVLVIDAGAPRNAPATHLHGFLSRDGLPPAELLATGRDEVKSYGGQIRDGTVAELLPDGGGGFSAL